jgi:hypothetical protein
VAAFGCSRPDARVVGAILAALGVERLAAAFWLNSWSGMSAALLVGCALILGAVLALLAGASGARRS